MRREIMVALSAGDSLALGGVWRITSKNSDFYLDTVDDPGGSVGHLSVHGPRDQFPEHRFHMKVDRKTMASARRRGHLVEHGVPRAGFAFDGERVGAHAYRVARLRWTWNLQRPRFRAAAGSMIAPELGDAQFGARLSDTLAPNDAWDIDIIISYDAPFWPNAEGSLRDNARLGPLHNDAGLWLTATSYHRSQTLSPAPSALVPRLPALGETATRITCGGPGGAGRSGMYWFVETITARELLEATAVERGHPLAGGSEDVR